MVNEQSLTGPEHFTSAQVCQSRSDSLNTADIQNKQRQSQGHKGFALVHVYVGTRDRQLSQKYCLSRQQHHCKVQGHASNSGFEMSQTC